METIEEKLAVLEAKQRQTLLKMIDEGTEPLDAKFNVYLESWSDETQMPQQERDRLQRIITEIAAFRNWVQSERE